MVNTNQNWDINLNIRAWHSHKTQCITDIGGSLAGEPSLSLLRMDEIVARSQSKHLALRNMVLHSLTTFTLQNTSTDGIASLGCTFPPALPLPLLPSLAPPANDQSPLLPLLLPRIPCAAWWFPAAPTYLLCISFHKREKRSSEMNITLKIRKALLSQNGWFVFSNPIPNKCSVHTECFFSLVLPLKVRSTKKARLGVSRPIYVNVDSPNLGFPYFNLLGGYQWKKHPVTGWFSKVSGALKEPRMFV